MAKELRGIRFGSLLVLLFVGLSALTFVAGGCDESSSGPLIILTHTPTPSPSRTPTSSLSPKPSPTPSLSPTPSRSPTPSPSPMPVIDASTNSSLIAVDCVRQRAYVPLSFLDANLH